MSPEPSASSRERTIMVEQQLRRRGIRDERVLAAMSAVARDAFVPERTRSLAYSDSALPLSLGQTISQPYMVARAAELASLSPDDVVLEVGLGSGYQAAVLAQLARRVIGIERLAPLTERARETFAALGIHNVEAHTGDGSVGFAGGAPYDAIVVSAGAPRIPSELVEQLTLGGRLVIPVGDDQRQTLTRAVRREHGLEVSEHDLCVYVPLRGASAWTDEA